MKSALLWVLLALINFSHTARRFPRGVLKNELQHGAYITREVKKSEDKHHNEDKNNIYVNDSVTLECHYPKNGEWTAKWFFKNRPLIVNQSYDDFRYRVLKLVLNVTSNDDGIYTCQIMDDSNNLINIAETVRVTEIAIPFSLSHHKKVVSVLEGNTAHLECDLIGVPHPNYSWLRNLEKLKETGRILEIETTTANDNGIFKCQATNRAGTTEQEIELRVKDYINEATTDTLETVTKIVELDAATKRLNLLEEHPDEVTNSVSEAVTKSFALSEATSATTEITFVKNEMVTDTINHQRSETEHGQVTKRGFLVIPLLILLIFIILASICFVVFIQRYFAMLSENTEGKEDAFEMLLTPISSETVSPGVENTSNKKHDVIQFKEVIGSGNFGVVRAGLLTRKPNVDSGLVDKLDVAIKSPKNENDFIQTHMLHEEFAIIKDIPKHPNILTLIGGVHENFGSRKLVRIIYELCDNKSLTEFMKTHKDGFVDELTEHMNDGYLNTKRHRPVPENPSELATTDLLSFSYQIANGMSFLAEKKCIHRDLAARNVLLKSNHICRISDFGLTRKLDNSETYRSRCQTGSPWRWMSVEAYNENVFTEKSDVWSFACLLFELFSLGDLPYKNFNCNGDQDFGDYLNEGKINDKPKYCNDEIYDLMKECWRLNPTERPSFAACFGFFEQFLKNHSPKKLSALEELIETETLQQTDLERWYTE